MCDRIHCPFWDDNTPPKHIVKRIEKLEKQLLLLHKKINKLEEK
jgi:hypothetical protein